MSVFVSGYPAKKKNLNQSIGPTLHDIVSVFLLAVSGALSWPAPIYISLELHL